MGVRVFVLEIIVESLVHLFQANLIRPHDLLENLVHKPIIFLKELATCLTEGEAFILRFIRVFYLILFTKKDNKRRSNHNLSKEGAYRPPGS